MVSGGQRVTVADIREDYHTITAIIIACSIPDLALRIDTEGQFVDNIACLAFAV